MASLKSGMDYFNKIAAAHAENPQEVRNILSKHHTDLTSQIERQDAGRRDPELLDRLRTVEIAAAAAQWTDINHPNARSALEKAAKGLSPTGQSLASRRFEMAEEAARAPAEKPLDRVTIRADHNRPS